MCRHILQNPLIASYSGLFVYRIIYHVVVVVTHRFLAYKSLQVSIPLESNYIHLNNAFNARSAEIHSIGSDFELILYYSALVSVWCLMHASDILYNNIKCIHFQFRNCSTIFELCGRVCVCVVSCSSCGSACMSWCCLYQRYIKPFSFSLSVFVANAKFHLHLQFWCEPYQIEAIPFMNP